ncbi:MAG: thioesterase domain-containing protein [Candidatus Sulfotelmatobacter sp.]
MPNLVLQMSCAETVEALTEIWQRVLGRTNIGPEDEFVDLGGNGALADRIFAEIARVFNRQLPSAIITHAPTIAALAALLEQPTLPAFPPLVKLKSGVEKTPIFIAHGLDGRARFQGLAKHMRTANAIYGFQAKGLDGLEEPFERIEDMAALYLEAVCELQPVGPYILIGYSFGGLITLEMAQRLAEAGKEVALLALVDAYPHPRYLSPGPRLRLMVRRTLRHFTEMSHRPPGDAISYFTQGLERRLRLDGDRKRNQLPPETSPLSYARTTLRVRDSAYVAYGRYRPRFYRGKISFVKAQSNSYFPDNPAAIWGKMADEFEVTTVPGDHLDMVTSGFENLAAALTDYLRRVRQQE